METNERTKDTKVFSVSFFKYKTFKKYELVGQEFVAKCDVHLKFLFHKLGTLNIISSLKYYI